MALANVAEELDRLIESERVVEAVVIGSGYGAGVCAARLAEVGVEVVVLERGREFSVSAGQPFPDTSKACRENMQLSGGPFDDTHRLGLYDFHVSRDLDVLVGCGLGGTSLINANVSIEPDKAVFAQAMWPAVIREEAAANGLAPYYDRARSVLQPSPWRGAAGSPVPRKLLAMEANGATRTHLNVFFDPPGKNSVGVPQRPCENCGDCVTGCNCEAKKTLCFTYLPIAKSYGAKIFVQCDVRNLEQRADGTWLVHFQRLATGHEPVADEGALFTLRARRVFVGAGVMGTTGILLRSQQLGLPISAELGGRVSGNGDGLAFAYNCDTELDSVGDGPPCDPAHPVGPSITAVIDRRPGVPLADGIIIEDGAFPSGLASILRWLVEAAACGGEETRHGFTHWFHERVAEARDLCGTPRDGALNRTLIFLLMGHDGADGEIELDGHGRPTIRWPQLHDREVFTAENGLARKVAGRLGGMFVPDPLNTKWFNNNLVTVHPLGGCPMGDDPRNAVVDDAGRVYDDRGGTLAGLYVSDASVIPTSLGVNPLLTITALAERMIERVVRDDLGKTPRHGTTIAPGTIVIP